MFERATRPVVWERLKTRLRHLNDMRVPGLERLRLFADQAPKAGPIQAQPLGITSARSVRVCCKFATAAETATQERPFGRTLAGPRGAQCAAQKLPGGMRQSGNRIV